MIASERSRYILQSLNAKGIINLKEIAKNLEISEVTVRRDFEKLESEGKLKRVVGGATIETSSEEKIDAAELTMNQKIGLHIEAKTKICKFASELVSDGDCIFLDGGTSMVPLAEILSRKNIKIVTYNSLVLQHFANARAEIFLVGGRFLPHYDMVVGSVAQENLKQFNFDAAFMGCSGLDLQQGWAYTTEMESLLMKRIGLENASRSYLLADDSKLQQKGFLKFSETSAFTKIISNQVGVEHNGTPNLILV